MLKRRRILNVAALLLVAAFFVGLVRLLVLRYSTGDVFPPYSSLRTDPLGAKILYESLRSLPDREVVRNERDLDRLENGEGRTLLVIGVGEASLFEKERIALEHFVQTGGRFVVTSFPKYQAPPKKKSSSPSPSPSPEASPTPEPKPTPMTISLKDLLARWEVNLKFDQHESDNVARRRAKLPLEEQLAWHSGISFQPQHEDWQIIYQCKRGPVVIERKFGAGSVVLVADSYFLSNEALLVDRSPEILAWLTGPARHLIFDETHLNIHEQPGVATLLRRYGLGGFVVGFLVLVGLWLWRNATWSLSLRHGSEREDAIVSGRDSFAGFVNLLRRGIAPGQLLEVCQAEWKRSAPHSTQTKTLAQEIETIATEDAGNPVTRYNRISELLNSRKWKTNSAI